MLSKWFPALIISLINPVGCFECCGDLTQNCQNEDKNIWTNAGCSASWYYGGKRNTCGRITVAKERPHTQTCVSDHALFYIGKSLKIAEQSSFCVSGGKVFINDVTLDDQTVVDVNLGGGKEVFVLNKVKAKRAAKIAVKGKVSGGVTVNMGDSAQLHIIGVDTGHYQPDGLSVHLFDVTLEHGANLTIVDKDGKGKVFLESTTLKKSANCMLVVNGTHPVSDNWNVVMEIGSWAIAGDYVCTGPRKKKGTKPPPREGPQKQPQEPEVITISPSLKFVLLFLGVFGLGGLVCMIAILLKQWSKASCAKCTSCTTSEKLKVEPEPTKQNSTDSPRSREIDVEEILRSISSASDIHMVKRKVEVKEPTDA